MLKFGKIADMPLAEFRRILDVNAVGCWLGMKSVIEPMTAAGGGSIVNISSIEGFTGTAGLSAYSASKFAIRGMTKAAAQRARARSASGSTRCTPAACSPAWSWRRRTTPTTPTARRS